MSSPHPHIVTSSRLHALPTATTTPAAEIAEINAVSLDPEIEKYTYTFLFYYYFNMQVICFWKN